MVILFEVFSGGLSIVEVESILLESLKWVVVILWNVLMIYFENILMWYK